MWETKAYQLPPLVRLTDETEFGLWQTPTVPTVQDAPDRTLGHHNSRGEPKLSGQVKLWPTPASRDYRHPNAQSYSERCGGTKGEQLPNAVGGSLNPTWVE